MPTSHARPPEPIACRDQILTHIPFRKESSMTPIRSLLAGLLLVAGIAPAQLVVAHRSSSGNGNVTEMKPDIKIKNTGTASVDLSKISIDYLFYENGIAAGSLVPTCNYVSPSQCTDMSIDIASIPLQTNGAKSANFRARIAFASGSLAAGQELSMQWGIHGQGWNHFFKESDDWSYTSNNGQWNPAPGIVVANPGPPGMTLPMSWNGAATSLPTTVANGVVMRNSTSDAVSVYDGAGWAILAQGVAGPKGPTGDRGPQGDPGPVGDTGLIGPVGGYGPSGPTGPMGLQGIQGVVGDAGIQGPPADLTVQTAKLNTLLATVAGLRAKLASPIVAVSHGVMHSLILRTDGSVWAAGLNSDGELGDGTKTNRTTPVLVMLDVKAMGAAYWQSYFLKTDNSLWMTGGNVYGNLGDGTTTSRASPIQVLTNVKSVALGATHTMALKNDGSLWACGSNNMGAFGDGSASGQSNSFVQVNTDVAAVSAGGYFTLILKTNGDLYATGDNSSGQLGDGTTINKSTPVLVAQGIKSISAGYQSSYFIKNDGTLWSTGSCEFGQCGVPGSAITNLTPILVTNNAKEVASSNSIPSTFVAKMDGSLWASGKNEYGQLGLGSASVIRQLTQVTTGVLAITGGGTSSGFVKTNNTLWASGMNGSGEFGNGTTARSSTPVQVIF